MTPRPRVVAHLGDAEPGSAWADCDGDLWVVWPDGCAGMMEAWICPTGARATTTTIGPFHLIGSKLTREECDAVGRANCTGQGDAARALARRAHVSRLGSELPIEGIDEQGSGLRWAVAQ